MLNAIRDMQQFLEREHIQSVIVVTPLFRSRRSALVYEATFGRAGITVRCEPVQGAMGVSNWTRNWHGIQDVMEQWLRAPISTVRAAIRLRLERLDGRSLFQIGFASATCQNLSNTRGGGDFSRSAVGLARTTLIPMWPKNLSEVITVLDGVFHEQVLSEQEKKGQRRGVETNCHNRPKGTLSNTLASSHHTNFLPVSITLLKKTASPPRLPRPPLTVPVTLATCQR